MFVKTTNLLMFFNTMRAMCDVVFMIESMYKLNNV